MKIEQKPRSERYSKRMVAGVPVNKWNWNIIPSMLPKSSILKCESMAKHVMFVT